MRALRWIAALAALASAAAVVATAQMKPGVVGEETQHIDIEAEPIATFWKDSAPPVANKNLEWRGGLVLSSHSPYFGGWSGLLMDADGKSLLAISDTGNWMTGEMVYDGDRPRGMISARIGSLKGGDGKPLSGKDLDAEAVTLASGTLTRGAAYIGFERNSRIALADIDRNGVSPIKSLLPIPDQARYVGNDGFEAMFRLATGPHAGSLVALLESPIAGETMHRGWIWIDGKPEAFSIDGVGDYGITDAVSLPDGGTLLLERRFRITDGVRIRLRRLEAGAIAAGAIVKGEILLEADGANAEIDNLEALAMNRDSAGKTVVTLMSDDNFNHAVQRTLLLQFTLKDAHATAEAEPSSKTP